MQTYTITTRDIEDGQTLVEQTFTGSQLQALDAFLTELTNHPAMDTSTTLAVNCYGKFYTTWIRDNGIVEKF